MNLPFIRCETCRISIAFDIVAAAAVMMRFCDG